MRTHQFAISGRSRLLPDDNDALTEQYLAASLRSGANSFAACFFLVVFFFATSECVAFQQTDQSETIRQAVKLIQGLKERRLFKLAEIYAREQIVSELIDSVGNSTIVLEQIRTKVAEAISLSGNARKNAWDQAEEIARDFIATNPGHPRKMLIDVQDALTNLSHGSLIRQELDAEIVASAWSKIALEQFRLATTKFRQIEKAIEKQLPITRNKTLDECDLTPDQLVNLKNNIRYRLAVVNLAKAQLYDAGDRLNQVDALNQVLLRLDEVVTQSNSDIPLWWEAQISRAKCYRLMKEIQRTQRLFANLPESKLIELTEELKGKLLTERILSAVEFNESRLWNGLFNEYSNFKNPAAELRLAVLQLLMANASKSSGADKKNWQSHAMQLVRAIETSHGRYWGRRAEILLVGSVETGNGQQVASSDFEILVRQGNTAFRKQNFVAAIGAFSKAAKFARDSGDANQSLVMTVRLSQCFENQKQHRLAAEKLFAVADQFPSESHSAAVHLRGCWNLAKVTDAVAKEELDGRLRAQINRWPEDESANSARLWLGNLYQSAAAWGLAVDTYLGISIDGSMMLEAVPHIGPCAKKWIEFIRSNDGDWESEARQYVGMIRAKLDLEASFDKSEWLESEQWLLLSLVDIGLPVDAVASDDAIRLLDSALGNDDQNSDRWRQQALGWRVVAVAKNVVSGDQSLELQQELKKLPNEASIMSICIRGTKENLTEKQFESISESIVIICDKAIVDGDSKNSEYWKIEKAIATVSTDQSESAVSELALLADKNPKSLKIQLAYARALSKLGQNPDQAKKQWRRLAAKVKKGTEPWYESKYNIVRMMIVSEQFDEAKKLVQYLQATTPNWDRSKWKKKFEQLAN